MLDFLKELFLSQILLHNMLPVKNKIWIETFQASKNYFKKFLATKSNLFSNRIYHGQWNQSHLLKEVLHTEY